MRSENLRDADPLPGLSLAAFSKTANTSENAGRADAPPPIITTYRPRIHQRKSKSLIFFLSRANFALA